MKIMLVIMAAGFFFSSVPQVVVDKSPWVTDRNLYTISFYDDLLGWIGGQNGIILKTVDGGISWTIINTNYPDYSFADLKVFDSQNLFARVLGRRPYIETKFIVSTNGGVNWADVPLPDTSQFKLLDAWAFSMNNYVGAGEDSLVARTTDAGVSWTIEQYSPSSGFHLRKILYLNDSTGWMTGYKGEFTQEEEAFYMTTDGSNWIKTADSYLTAFSFSNPDTGYAFTKETFYKTIDGGITWLTLPFPAEYIKLTALHTEGDNIYAASGFIPPDDGNPSIWSSTNGGTSWESTNHFNEHFEIYGITATPGGKIFICGQHGYIAEALSRLDFKPLMGDFVTGVYAFDDEVFVAGYDEKILRTIDNGDNWEEISTGSYGPKTIMFADNFTGFITVGNIYNYHNNTKILKTTDKGLSWNLMNYPVDEILSLVDKDGGIYAYEVVDFSNESLYRSHDLGSTWTKLMDFSSYQPYVYALDSMNIWVGLSNDDRRTTDAGTNWTILNYPVDRYEFFTPDSGIGISYSGMKYTSDGGANWFDLHNNAVFFRPAELIQHKYYSADYAYFLFQGPYIPTEDETLYPFYLDKYMDGDTSEVIEYMGKIFSSFSFDNNYNCWIAAGRSILKVTVDPVIIVASDETPIPIAYNLLQNYPNPFNPATTIRYSIPVEGEVILIIYNSLGQEVFSSKEYKSPGEYEFEFNAKGLSSGVYFYSLKSGEYFKSRKFIVLK